MNYNGHEMDYWSAAMKNKLLRKIKQLENADM